MKSFIRFILLGAAAWAATGGLYAAQVDLSIQDNSNDETGFTFERAPGLNATTGFAVLANRVSSDAEKTGTGIRAYRDTSAAPATPYSYRGRAYNAGGASVYSNTASVVTAADLPPPPAAPGDSTATPVVPTPYEPPSATITLNAGESLLIMASVAPPLVPAIEQ